MNGKPFQNIMFYYCPDINKESGKPKKTPGQKGYYRFQITSEDITGETFKAYQIKGFGWLPKSQVILEDFKQPHGPGLSMANLFIRDWLVKKNGWEPTGWKGDVIPKVYK